MKVRNIALGEDEMPTAIEVVMSTREAAFIARVLGAMTGTAQSEVQSDGSTVGSDIYDALVGGVFNRFWEDGVNEVGR